MQYDISLDIHCLEDVIPTNEFIIQNLVPEAHLFNMCHVRLKEKFEASYVSNEKIISFVKCINCREHSILKACLL